MTTQTTGSSSQPGGTGFVALHGGSATFWSTPAYLQMLGSRWINHQPLKRFTVHIEQPSHPIVAGVTDLELLPPDEPHPASLATAWCGLLPSR